MNTTLFHQIMAVFYNRFMYEITTNRFCVIEDRNNNDYTLYWSTNKGSNLIDVSPEYVKLLNYSNELLCEINQDNVSYQTIFEMGVKFFSPE